MGEGAVLRGGGCKRSGLGLVGMGVRALGLKQFRISGELFVVIWREGHVRLGLTFAWES